MGAVQALSIRDLWLSAGGPPFTVASTVEWMEDPRQDLGDEASFEDGALEPRPTSSPIITGSPPTPHGPRSAQTSRAPRPGISHRP